MRNLILIFSLSLLLSSCGNIDTQQTSDSGVAKATTKVATDEKGQTAEQRNIINRLQRDNEIGSIKHLYIISSYSGDVMEYSTVLGKVTSGGKRLSPRTVNGSVSTASTTAPYNWVRIGDKDFVTDEVLDDGGAYGDSGTYLYWFDAQGNYHQYYPSGGTYLHISDRPLRIKKANFSVTLMSDSARSK